MTGRTQARLLVAVLFAVSAMSNGIRLFWAAQSDSGFAALSSPFAVLPAEMQDTIKALLTIPIAIIALVFVRQFIGMSTIGTFMPVLIGVSLRETGLIYGLVLLAIIIAVGVACRFYFERLKLLLIPRLAAIVIIVVISMLGCAYLFTISGIQVAASVSLFPLVIMAMTIERVVVAWEENGSRDTIKQSAGSLLIALLSYFIMSAPVIVSTMFIFPELQLVLFALAIMMGRYIGYRLTEYFRFSELGKTV